MTFQASQIQSNQKNDYYRIEKNLDMITKSLSIAYYKNTLIKLR
jgi:hypothetical protein